MKVIFIRHGKTLGNIEKRYIGRTDESLCRSGIRELSEKHYPFCDIVISSPMKRCVETASVIYPNKTPIIYYDLCECNFGNFEGKNYKELTDNIDYNHWIKSCGTASFPNGENPDSFKKRSIEAFEKAAFENQKADTLAFIVHGGTIMSVLEKLAIPKKDYYDYQIACGCGFVTRFNGNKIDILEQI